MQKFTTFLMFTGQAEEAMNLVHVAVQAFRDSQHHALWSERDAAPKAPCSMRPSP